MTGNLVLSHNSHLVKARVSSAAPRVIRNSKSIINIGRYKFKATIAAIKFIWGKPNPLTIESVQTKRPYVKT